jgi:hypothetical protein
MRSILRSFSDTVSWLIVAAAAQWRGAQCRLAAQLRQSSNESANSDKRLHMNHSTSAIVKYEGVVALISLGAAIVQ